MNTKNNMVSRVSSANATKAATKAGIPGLLASILMPKGIEQLGDDRLKKHVKQLLPDNPDYRGVEIEDPKMVVDDATVERMAASGGKFTLGDFLDFKNDRNGVLLAKAYPNIQDTIVVFDPNDERGSGGRRKGHTIDLSYGIGSKHLKDLYTVNMPDTIRIGTKGDGPLDFRNTLIHEMTHSILGREELPSGTNPTKAGSCEAYRSHPGERVADMQGSRAAMDMKQSLRNVFPSRESVFSLPYGPYKQPDSRDVREYGSTRQDAKGGEARSDSRGGKSYGKRPDGTEKGSGWLGELKLPDGRVATEYSVGVGFDGKETLIPTLVPTLTKEQVDLMVNDVIPNGKQVPDDIFKVAVDHAKAQMAKGESVWAPTNSVKEVRQDAKGGDSGEETQAEVPVQEPSQEVPAGGPRIAVNPAVFRDKRDALCVAMNEAYRVVMETNGFDPVSEPTDRQREFFSDTAYADDELMLRRTILARICTFDTSVGDPTDEQLQEAVEFLETVMEIGAPQNEWEQSIVQRTRDILAASIGMPRKERAPENPAPTDGGTGIRAGTGAGDTQDDPLADMFKEEDKDASADLDKALQGESQGATTPPQEDQGAFPAESPELKAEREGAEKAAEIAKGMQEAAQNGPIDDQTYGKVKEAVESGRGESASLGTEQKPAEQKPAEQPQDKFAAAHQRFLERQKGFAEKNPNAVAQGQSGNGDGGGDGRRRDLAGRPLNDNGTVAQGPARGADFSEQFVQEDGKDGKKDEDPPRYGTDFSVQFL